MNKDVEPTLFPAKHSEVADLFDFGAEVFGNDEKFFHWLGLTNQSIGGIKPIELLVTTDGVSIIRDVIGRIEHGVYE